MRYTGGCESRWAQVAGLTALSESLSVDGRSSLSLNLRAHSESHSIDGRSSLGMARSMDDLLSNGDTAALQDTRAGRACGLVRHYHRQLIGARRPQLDALKRGFGYGGDLRPALQVPDRYTQRFSL